MFDVGAFFLKFVIVILKHLNKLLVVLDALLVVQLYVLEINAVVVRDVRHTTKLAVLCRHVINQVGQVVDLAHQLSDLLFLLFFLLAKQVNPLDRFLDILVSTIEGQVVLEAVDFLKQLLLILLKCCIFVVEGLNFALEIVIFTLKPHHLTSLIFLSQGDLLRYDLFDAIDITSCIIQLLSILVSCLYKLIQILN